MDDEASGLVVGSEDDAPDVAGDVPTPLLGRTVELATGELESLELENG
jgi:hypothetical protein